MLSDGDRVFLAQQATTLVGRELSDAERDILFFSIENNVDPSATKGFDVDDGSGLFMVMGFLLRVWTAISTHRTNKQNKEHQKRIEAELAELKKQFATLEEEKKQAVID